MPIQIKNDRPVRFRIRNIPTESEAVSLIASARIYFNENGMKILVIRRSGEGDVDDIDMLVTMGTSISYNDNIKSFNDANSLSGFLKWHLNYANGFITPFSPTIGEITTALLVEITYDFPTE